MDLAERIFVLSRRLNAREVAAVLNVGVADVAATMRDFADAPQDPIDLAIAGASGGLQPKGVYDPAQAYPRLSVVGAFDGKLYYATEDAAAGEGPGGGTTQVVAMRSRVGLERDRVGATPRQFAVVDATTNFFGRHANFVIQSVTDTTFTVRNLAGPAMDVTGYYGANNTGSDGTWVGEVITVAPSDEATIHWTGGQPQLIFCNFAGNVNGLLEAECPAGEGPPSAKWSLLNPVAA